MADNVNTSVPASWLRRGPLVLAMLCAWFGLAHAADYALLIGVADYPNLPRRLWLRGPINDVGLVRGALLEKGFAAEHIQTLTSRAGPTVEPTRHNIVRAFAAMRNRVQPGDRVFFYLAGHGSQQPQPLEHPGRPTEADGSDEVFLPADVGQWDGSGAKAAIPNALLDDEIGDWMDALVDAGATVWGVFDACHAAGIARGGRPRGRGISASDLGLPIAAHATGSRQKQLGGQETTGGAATARAFGSARLDGRSLAFAARSHELTGEEWLPRGASLAKARRHGVFTFHFVRALRAGALTTSALQHAVGAGYAAESRISPVPQWLGRAEFTWP